MQSTRGSVLPTQNVTLWHAALRQLAQTTIVDRVIAPEQATSVSQEKLRRIFIRAL